MYNQKIIHRNLAGLFQVCLQHKNTDLLDKQWLNLVLKLIFSLYGSTFDVLKCLVQRHQVEYNENFEITSFQEHKYPYCNIKTWRNVAKQFLIKQDKPTTLAQTLIKNC